MKLIITGLIIVPAMLTNHIQELSKSHQEAVTIRAEIQLPRAHRANIKPVKKKAVKDTAPVKKPVKTLVRKPDVAWAAQCKQWAKEAGIILNQSAINLIEKESRCNPNAVNPTSGACGIGQNINGCTVGRDPKKQLIWMHLYIKNRYGTWDGAWNFWLNNNYY